MSQKDLASSLPVGPWAHRAGAAAEASWPLRLWQTGSAFGNSPLQSLEDQRKIRVCNQSAMIAATSCAGFALAFAFIDLSTLWPLMLLNTLDGALMASAMLWNARGRHMLARSLFLAMCNVHILLAAMCLGPAAGFQFYYFPFTAVSFLLIPLRRLRIPVFPLMSFACFGYMTYFARQEHAWLPIPTAALGALHVGSAALTTATLAFVVYLFDRATLHAEAMLVEEHERSERLLLNVLPASISERLKAGQGTIADRFDEATVLFADLVGFTELSGRMRAEELATMLNRVFSRFDDLSERHGLEKIKTIGDAYMVVGGLPVPREDHADAVVRMALDMRDALAEVAQEMEHPLTLRIGVHTGPVVAGVIGKRKFIYDLWGDTVNTASRMESHGVPGRVQVTDAVRSRLRGVFALTERGVIAVKGKGEMVTYFVERPPQAAES